MLAENGLRQMHGGAQEIHCVAGAMDVHMVPEDGPENPLFARVEKADSIHVTIAFARALGDAELDAVERIALGWYRDAEWQGTPPQLENETLVPTCLHLAITGVTTARAPLTTLIDALRRAGVPLHQVILGRFGPDKVRATLLALMDPGAPREARYDDEGAWWRACFDASSAPPLSEDQGELFTDENALIEGVIEGRGTTFAEHRGLPLHVPGMRICYGVGDFQFTEGDRRSMEVTRVFRAALDVRFRGCWPEPFEGMVRPAAYNVKGQRDGALDRIQKDGKVGYSCLFTTRDLREFLHGHVFRYREYELMLALRDTARALDLEAVVCWKRFTRRYVIQLWERSRSRVPFAA